MPAKPTSGRRGAAPESGAPIVLLLRGINVGRAKRIAMADLRSLLKEMGYTGARTHLQSGNVVLRAGDDPDAVARAVEQELEHRCGFAVDVVARTAEQLTAIAAANPLAAVADNGSRSFVAFLSEAPHAERLAQLTAQNFAPEQLAADGRELYAWCPGGAQDSPLLKALGKAKVAPVVTVRNWNTVAKLAAMLDETR